MEKPRITFKRLASGPAWQVTWPEVSIREASRFLRRLSKYQGSDGFVGRGIVIDDPLLSKTERPFLRERDLDTAINIAENEAWPP